MEDERWLMMAVLQHLRDASQRDHMNSASLEEAIFAISNAYSLNMRNAATAQRYPLHGLSLVQIFKAGQTQLLEQRKQHSDALAFDRFLTRLKHSTSLFDGLHPHSAEYQRRVQRARDKFESRRAAKRTSADDHAHVQQRAEALKNDGNQKLKEKKYAEALQLYDQSIKLCPHNAVYHSNRAAANMLLRRFEEALNDCNRAIELDATFVRPRERLAHAYRQLGRTAEEVHALQQALSLDACNESLKRQLDDANARLRDGGGAASGVQHLLRGGGGGGGGGANMEEMMCRLGRDGVSNMANMLGMNVPSEALDELFADGGVQQMQDMINRNPQMVQQTMNSLMRGELPSAEQLSRLERRA